MLYGSKPDSPARADFGAEKARRRSKTTTTSCCSLCHAPLGTTTSTPDRATATAMVSYPSPALSQPATARLPRPSSSLAGSSFDSARWHSRRTRGGCDCDHGADTVPLDAHRGAQRRPSTRSPSSAGPSRPLLLLLLLSVLELTLPLQQRDDPLRLPPHPLYCRDRPLDPRVVDLRPLHRLAPRPALPRRVRLGLRGRHRRPPRLGDDHPPAMDHPRRQAGRDVKVARDQGRARGLSPVAPLHPRHGRPRPRRRRRR